MFACRWMFFFFDTHLHRAFTIAFTDTSLYVIETLPSYKGWRGEDAALPCNFSGNFSQVCWKKDKEIVRCHNDTISGENRIRMDGDFGLIITELQLTDEANFTCQVTRMDGTKISSGTYLTVNGNNKNLTYTENSSVGVIMYQEWLSFYQPYVYMV